MVAQISGNDDLRTVTVVTGAASGIGLASTHRFVERGDIVGLVDIDEEALFTLADRLSAEGATVRTLAADVLDIESLIRFCEALVTEFGFVSYALSNAGSERPSSVDKMTLQDWESVIQTHVTGSFNLCKAVLPHMIKAQDGAVALMASDFAIVGFLGQANYAAAKTAVYSLAKSLALEMADYDVRVNAIGPGPIDTPLLRRGRTPAEWSTDRREIEKRVPMGRLGEADEVAATAAFLLSDRSNYITGQLLQPNGGQVMW